MRGWLRRAAGRAGQVREVFTALAAAVSADPVPLEPAGSPLADALVGGRGGGRRGGGAVAAAARGVAVGDGLGGHNGTLLAPVMAARGFNASSLW